MNVGDCFDNAMCESFFATLECELQARSRCQLHEQGRGVLFAFIVGWYNLGRQRSATSYHALIRYETIYQRKMLAAGELPTTSRRVGRDRRPTDRP
ncbi:hypothetical protein [Trinickia sp.]|uniref:hypothetical protein n=1 Tax=Trinickia sp. TaxID=2571163 RepID=UPI003F8097A5